MSTSIASHAPPQFVKLEHGVLDTFNGSAKSWPWFWKKFRACAMKLPNVWLILNKQKGRREQLQAHADAKGDTKRFFPVFESRNANNTLTVQAHDKANQRLRSLWMSALTRDASDLTIGVEEGDGMSITANALLKFDRADVSAKMHVCFNTIRCKQAKTESLDACATRTKINQQKIKDMKITLEELLTAFYLRGLDARCAHPRESLIMQDNVTMEIAISKLSTVKNFNDATRNMDSSTGFVRKVTLDESATRKPCTFCNILGHQESECRKKIAAKIAARKNPRIFRSIEDSKTGKSPLSVKTLVTPPGQANNVAGHGYELDDATWAWNPCLTLTNSRPTSQHGHFSLFLDNCCSYNIWAGQPSDLADFKSGGNYTPPPPVNGAGDNKFQPSGSGWLHGFQFHYCPEVGANLLSQGYMQRLGYNFDFKTPKCIITDADGSKIMETTMSNSNVHCFSLPFNSPRNSTRHELRASPLAHLAGGKPTNLAVHLHQQMGHPNLRLLQRMLRRGGYTKIKHVPASHFTHFPTCNGCALGKGFKISKSTPGAQPELPAPTKPFQHCSIDISGRISTKGLSNQGAAVCEHFCVLVCHFTNVKLTKCLESREDMRTAVAEIADTKIKPLGFKLEHLTVLRGDNEFDTSGMRALAAAQNFRLTLTVPSCSFLNPNAERGVGTLSTRGRTCLLDAKIPDRFWPKAVSFAEACELRAHFAYPNSMCPPGSGHPHWSVSPASNQTSHTFTDLDPAAGPAKKDPRSKRANVFKL